MENNTNDKNSNSDKNISKNYILIKDNKSYNILITKSGGRIIFKSREYELITDLEHFIKSTNIDFESINIAFDFVIDLFDKNRAFIKDISKIIMNIILSIYEKEININLVFNNLIPDEINSLINITYDAFSYYNYDNSFIIFTTIEILLYLVYATQEKSIKCFNILDNEQIIEIKNAEEDSKYITNFRHFYDKQNKRDLIMSISGIKNNIKIWEINNWECIINIKDIYKTGNIFSSCFINDNNNNIYIITSNCSLFKNSQPLKIFDLNGNFIKDINKSIEKTFFVGTYYDINKSKNYIITVNKDNLKSYDYDENLFYKKYQEIKENKKMNFDDYHYNYTINDFDNICQLIDSGDDGYIRIWNFHEGNLIKKIEIDKNCILSLCLWNSDYLFASSEDHLIKLIDLQAGIVIKNIIGHVDIVCTIKKIYHPKYGECLISQGYKKDQIKLWINKN